MKKFISALIVVIAVGVGAVYVASNKVEEHYQRMVGKLNDVNGFKVSGNKYEKGLIGSNGSFDLTISRELFENITGEDVDEDLKFKVDSTISHSVLAFLSGFEIDSKISIQNDMIKNVVASFLGSNVVANVKTRATLAGNKDVSIKFGDVDFHDKKTALLSTKDAKISMMLDAKENLNSAKIEVNKIILKDLNEDDRGELSIEGIYVDSSYETPAEFLKILENKLVPYTAKFKVKKAAFVSKNNGNILIEDLGYDSRLEISNDLGSLNDVIKIGAIVIDKIKYTDFVLDSKITNLNVPILNKILEKLNNINDETNYDIFYGLNFDEIAGQILEKNPSIKINTLSFKNGDKRLNLNLDAAVNGFTNGANQLEIFNKLSLSGKLSVDESLEKFFDTLVPEMAFIEPTLISAGYLKEDNKRVVSEFKYDSSKKDLIFNGKVGLQNFFTGF
jgi:hypothetical protein